MGGDTTLPSPAIWPLAVRYGSTWSIRFHIGTILTAMKECVWGGRIGLVPDRVPFTYHVIPGGLLFGRANKTSRIIPSNPFYYTSLHEEFLADLESVFRARDCVPNGARVLCTHARTHTHTYMHTSQPECSQCSSFDSETQRYPHHTHTCPRTCVEKVSLSFLGALACAREWGTVGRGGML